MCFSAKLVVTNCAVVSCAHVYGLVRDFFAVGADHLNVDALRAKLARFVMVGHHAAGKHMFIHFTYFNKKVLGECCGVPKLPSEKCGHQTIIGNAYDSGMDLKTASAAELFWQLAYRRSTPYTDVASE